MKTTRALMAAIALALTIPSLAVAKDGFRWTSSAPLITPPVDASQTFYGVKDPSIVHVDGQYHVFMTTAGNKGWGLAYTHFSDWAEAPKAPIIGLDKSPMGPGYRAAPQVFYFAPQKLWYLIYQGGDPLYSTSTNINDPLSWSAPKPFFATAPDIMKQATGKVSWLDFWIICDDATCYLFNTDDEGNFFRSETPLSQYPNGFHNSKLVMKGDRRDDMFEASNTYKVAGTNNYITMIEAIGPKGRYFRAWKSDRLDGAWTPLTTDAMNVFASADNVEYDGPPWSEGVSHGEMIRTNPDQTLSIDPCQPLQFLYQGLKPNKASDYLQLPYNLAVLTAKGPNPVSAMCPKKTN